MDADDWLRVIKTKLDLTNCTDEECVALAVHQLEGPTKSWWDSYCDSHQDPAHITWEEFARAFPEQHVPRQVLIQACAHPEGLGISYHDLGYDEGGGV
jgi:L-rhamnose isomerase